MWDELLAERVPQGKIFNLETINGGFIRPGSRATNGRWPIARPSCMPNTCWTTSAPDALAKMLAAYADNLDTRAAIKRSFNVGQEEFESGYLEYLRKIDRAGWGDWPSATSRSWRHWSWPTPPSPTIPTAAARLALALSARRISRQKPGRLSTRCWRRHPQASAGRATCWRSCYC